VEARPIWCINREEADRNEAGSNEVKGGMVRFDQSVLSNLGVTSTPDH
jgi:hypothetical protein